MKSGFTQIILIKNSSIVRDKKPFLGGLRLNSSLFWQHPTGTSETSAEKIKLCNTFFFSFSLI